MRLLLSLPLGLLIGILLGALGGGGSILAVPALVYVIGLEPKSAVTTSLVIVGVSALGGMVGHWRGGRVRVAAGLWFGVAGIAGSLVGSELNRKVAPSVLLVSFSVLMLIAAWRMWASVRHVRDDSFPATRVGFIDDPVDLPVLHLRAEEPLATTRGVPRSMFSVVGKVIAAGTVVGLMTGFFGVGGGFVIVPALVLVLGFGMPEAIGTSLLVIAINSGVALASRVATTGVAWRVAIPFTVAGLLGAVFGNRVSSKLPAATLVRWFVVLLVVVAMYTLVHTVIAPPAG